VGIKKVKLQKRKVGLALSSGAARGLAHIGVLEILGKEGIPIDMIAGASMGALVGAVYAQGKDVSQMKNLAIDWGAKRFSLLADPALPKTGLIRGRKIEEVLKSSLAGADVVIEPQTASIGHFDFHQAEECISQGEVAAQNLVPEIKRRLGEG